MKTDRQYINTGPGCISTGKFEDVHWLAKFARRVEWRVVALSLVLPIDYQGDSGPVLEQFLAQRWWQLRPGPRLAPLESRPVQFRTSDGIPAGWWARRDEDT